MRFAIVLLAACGGAQHDAASGPTCEQAAANERAVRDAAEPGDPHHALTVEERAHHCRIDSWSAESIRCYATTKEWEALKLCIDTLTSVQRQELLRAIKARE